METGDWRIKEAVRELARLQRGQEALRDMPHCEALKTAIARGIISTLERAASEGYHRSRHIVEDSGQSHPVCSYLMQMYWKYGVEYDVVRKR